MIPIKGYFSTAEIPLIGHPDTLSEILQIALTKVIDERYDGIRHDLKLGIGGDANNNLVIAVFGNVQYHPEWYSTGTLNQSAVRQFYKDLRTALYEALKGQGNLSHPDANLDALVTRFFIRPQSADLHGVQDRAKKATFGDQAHAIGYATAETKKGKSIEEGMPIEFVLARRLAWDLEQAVKDGEIVGGYDGKVIVSVEKSDSKVYGVREVIVAKQHEVSQSLVDIVKLVKEKIIPRSLGRYFNKDIEVQVNNGSAWNDGGVLADMGVPCDYPFYTGYWTGADAPTGEDRTKADGPLQFYSRAIAKALLEVLNPYGCRTVKVDVSTSIGSEEIKSLSVEIRDKDNKLMYTPTIRRKIIQDVLDIFPISADGIMGQYWCNPQDMQLLIERGAVFGYSQKELKNIFWDQGYRRISWEYIKDKVDLLKPRIRKYLKK